jgi:DNA modification methylase
LAGQDLDAELRDADAVPLLPEVPITVSGDLWILGDHRLLCGDATSMEAIEAVLGGRTVDMVFTDPPSDVANEGKTTERHKVPNAEQRDELFMNSFDRRPQT